MPSSGGRSRYKFVIVISAVSPRCCHRARRSFDRTCNDWPRAPSGRSRNYQAHGSSNSWSLEYCTSRTWPDGIIVFGCSSWRASCSKRNEPWCTHTFWADAGPSWVVSGGASRWRVGVVGGSGEETAGGYTTGRSMIAIPGRWAQPAVPRAHCFL